MLTQWGIDKARTEGMNTTLFATPMGFPLYRKLGFCEVGRVHVQVDGEKELLDIPAMVLVNDDINPRQAQ
jgi:hypothetical protein